MKHGLTTPSSDTLSSLSTTEPAFERAQWFFAIQGSQRMSLKKTGDLLTHITSRRIDGGEGSKQLLLQKLLSPLAAFFDTFFLLSLHHRARFQAGSVIFCPCLL